MYLATEEDALQRAGYHATIPVWIPDVNDNRVFSSERFGSMYEPRKGLTGSLSKMTFQVNRTSKSQCITRYDQGNDLSSKRLRFDAIEDNFFKVADMLHGQFKEISVSFQGTYTFSSAAYDPFFLSHIAYLDAYWARWQSLPNSKKTRGVVKDIRYVLKDASFKFKSTLFTQQYSKIINKKCIRYKSQEGLF
ncbi:hypothetical protein DSO57_1016643 [Entomophthora muscae]|uniref:Uncharacterized protein n=1 Tax=Entomophthora muscae TaxID=34485 RepID=A0ACC2U2X3_9FUNG|nr:hypothetical protein DSO57_1016643 [Entomophthora muscae]